MGKILIVEDELDIRTGLVKMVKGINAAIEVYETGSAKEALEYVQTDEIHAFFLDIQLEDYSGFELAKQIRELEKHKFTPIIFITAVHTREFEAFKNIHSYDYIIKPFSEDEVKKVFEDVINYGIRKPNEIPIIKIKDRGFTYIVNQEDIIYIEVKNRRLIIKTMHEEAEVTTFTLKKLLKELTEKFIQCHKSFIVNKQYIRKIDFINNELYVQKYIDSIPIGRKYKDNIRVVRNESL